MKKIKQILLENFEASLVCAVIAIIIFVDIVVVQKFSFLNCYYIPVLLAGYYIGKRGAVLTAFFAVLTTIIMVLVNPQDFFISYNSISMIYLNITVWGAFLLIAGYVVGALYEEREEKNRGLKIAYTGVVEILTKFIESVDRYTKGHSVRVADYSLSIAISMGLSREECENIRVAALLHDIGKIDISTNLIQKAAELSKEEKKEIDSHTEKGGDILSKVGSVLSEAVPLVIAHHEYFDAKIKDIDNLDEDEFNNDGTITSNKEKIPLGARIIAVADSYDAMVTDRPYRKGRQPWEALTEIKKHAGSQFDPRVVDAFQRVMGNFMDPNESDNQAI